MNAPNDWEKHLHDSVQRFQQALERGQGRQTHLIGELVATAGAQALAHVNEHLKEKRARQQRREEERARRRAERDEASKPQGFVMAGAAALLLVFAVANPATLWWLVFIAFGFSMGAASLLARGYRLDRERAALAAAAGGAALPPAAAALEAGVEARAARVEAICEKIQAEIKAGPEVLRQLVHRPDQTLMALRDASRELARREKELRQAVSKADEHRLLSERDQLTERFARERDEVVRGRLGLALQALDAQLAQRAELVTVASRLEAESTRILYTLENLYTQVLRARTADAASSEVVGAGLRRSLESLGEQIDAVADALECVHREGAQGVIEKTCGDEGASSGRPRERERT